MEPKLLCNKCKQERPLIYKEMIGDRNKYKTYLCKECNQKALRTGRPILLLMVILSQAIVLGLITYYLII